MATIQIADKSTLDNVATNVTYIKNNMPSGGGGTPKIAIFNTDSQYTGVTFTVSNEDFGFEQSVTLTGTKAEVEVPYLGEYNVDATIAGSINLNRTVDVTTAAATIIYDPKFIEMTGAFATCTDEELELILNYHYADIIDISDYWAVGDTRVIHLDEIGTVCKEQNITIVIVAFDHTDLVTPINGHTKAALTVQTKEVLSGTSDGISYDVYINGYRGNLSYPKWSSLYTQQFLNDENGVLGSFSSSFKSLIKRSSHYRHVSYNGSTSELINETIFLPSYPEIFGTASDSYYVPTNPVEGTQFTYYETLSNRIKYPNNNGISGASAVPWWDSSPSTYYTSANGYYWGNVGTGGYSTSGYGGDTRALAPAWAM